MYVAAEVLVESQSEQRLLEREEIELLTGHKGSQVIYRIQLEKEEEEKGT